MSSSQWTFWLCALTVVYFASPVAAFGAGNIASVSKIEGINWRHGDIEDLLTTVAFLRGHKWSSMMVKRAYFGNWLRDYSQAVDVGTLKGVQAETIRVLVWVLAFMSFGYATVEFEVTAERLGTYRPEEHIDNPKDYADNVDARKFDARLRGPVEAIELAVDPNTGMKNYIANENGHWATSLGYIKWSFARSIHYGRLYTHGPNKGREEDLCEALRCLGQGLHTIEDFGAHTNYTELALRELGFTNVFPHVGTQTMLNVRGKHIYPLTTGTFGGVDFLHSVLGEASDHVTQTEVNQSEVDQVNAALSSAAASSTRGIGGDPASRASSFTDLLATVPGTGNLIQEAIQLQADSDAQAAENDRLAASGSRGMGDAYGSYGDNYSGSRDASSGYRANSFQAPPGSQGGPPGPGIPGINMNIDPAATVKKIYPILAFRDRVVRTISGIVSKIPGLEKAIETISEKVTLFVMGLLAPYVKPVIAAASNALKQGSGTVVSASQKQQYIIWEDPTSSDPTHSLLSKDHFSNVLNDPAGKVAGVLLQYVAPRVIYGWDHPEVPEREIMDDISRLFHHPALRDHNCELHRSMFEVVEKWSRSYNGNINDILSSESVKKGRNHKAQDMKQSLEGLEGAFQNLGGIGGSSSHSATAGGPLAMFGQLAGRREIGTDLGSQGPYSSYNRAESGYASGQQYTAPGRDSSSYGGHDSTSYGQYQSSYDQQQQQGPPQQGYGGSSYQQQPPHQQGGGGYDQGYGGGGGGGGYQQGPSYGQNQYQSGDGYGGNNYGRY